MARARAVGPNEAGFTKSAAWTRLRDKVRLEEPRCRMCGTERGPFIIDHVIPRQVRPDLALSRANCQKLCVSCHERDKARVERRLYGMRKGADGKPQAVSRDGVHIDPQHPWARPR